MSEAMVLACSFGLSGFSLLLLHLFEKSWGLRGATLPMGGGRRLHAVTAVGACPGHAAGCAAWGTARATAQSTTLA